MQNDIIDQVEFRPSVKADESFIFSTWLRSYKHSSRFAQHIPSRTYFARHHKIIERIMGFPQTETVVCSPKDKADTILGYLVFTHVHPRPVIHFVYVKVPFRKFGVAKGLLEEANIHLDGAVYTHRTDNLEWVEQRFPGLQYDPYLI